MEQKRDKRSPKTKRKRKKSGRGFKIFITIVLVFVITMAMLACMAAAYIKNVILPEADLKLDEYNPNLTSAMYYKDPATGNYVEMQALYGEENRVWVNIEEMPQDLLDAAVAIEDKRFYKHNGVDWIRTVKAVTCMFTGADVQGGSTLTQQLIKNITTEDDVTVKRKVMEIFRALEFEKNYSKEDILTWYLNYIYLGQRCNGVYTASYKYFGKHVSELSLAECASLIGITNNPSKYDPLGHLEVVNEETGEVTTSRDFNKQRQELILKAMLDQDYITKEEYNAAVAEELNFDNGKDTQVNSSIYTWYEDAVIEQVLDDLVDTYDWSEDYARTKLFSGGLEIYTCMNPDVQAAVDEIYNNRDNLNYTSSTGQLIQSAITIVDNETGDVVAMAGGVGQKTTSRGWNRATDTLRPPGSSIKPLSVYAPAIELGYITPSSTFVDSPVKDGWPVNATGQYQGTVSVAKAIRESINTVAVKVLDEVGPQTSYEFMRDKFHIQLVESRSKNGENYTDIDLAPLALGGLTDGVSTFQMASAYSVFPRMGVYKEPRLYTVVLDANKDILLDNTQEEDKNALSERTCFYMTKMLQDVVTGPSGATGRAANFSGQDIAGKTGTTTSRKDLWFVGYTPYYTAAVWTGYDQQERLASGYKNPSAVLWNKVMSKIHLGLPYKQFDQPDTSQMQAVKVCAISGKLPGAACGGNIVTQYFFADDVPTTVCTVHKVEPEGPDDPTDDPGGDSPVDPGGEVDPPAPVDPTPPTPETPTE
ncbi:MAG: PBP1A family penicillin-binding protein [Ruminiclostridium sp.]|nr:PBP1A family penicillin-binding protein [Ruminiclostridium sp.]